MPKKRVVKLNRYRVRGSYLVRDNKARTRDICVDGYELGETEDDALCRAHDIILAGASGKHWRVLETSLTVWECQPALLGVETDETR